MERPPENQTLLYIHKKFENNMTSTKTLKRIIRNYKKLQWLIMMKHKQGLGLQSGGASCSEIMAIWKIA
jgi:hypothetical protein